jgi:hypothetical protein
MDSSFKPRDDDAAETPDVRLNETQSTPGADATERRRGSRLPSFRASAALAVAMLTLGVGVGAAIGPTPATSLAGSSGVVQQLPGVIASLAARAHEQRAAVAQPASTTTPPAAKRQATPATSTPASTSASTPAPQGSASTPASETETNPTKSTKPSAGGSKLPPITSVWLIELSGFSFTEATSNTAAAPYITAQLIPKGTLLSGWTALQASALASDAALVEHRVTVGGSPPVLHTIVQPPCPEGAAGAACAPGTPAGIAAADQFVQATLATIEATTTYAEHGLVVVTYATVADATSAELPAGATSATLASTPPAGAVLLSPFAKAGARSSVAFDPTSPVRSLEALLH